MNGIIFLVVWLYIADPAGDPVPTAQFISSTQSMKECSDIVARISKKSPELKNRMSCLHVISTSVVEDGSESL